MILIGKFVIFPAYFSMSDFRHNSKLELTPAVFSILSGLIDEKLGLQYTLLDREILQDKVSIRAIEAGYDSLLDYYYFLRYDDADGKELNELAEVLVVNETYFFREWPAIEVLVTNVIAPLCAKGQRPRIWSAACSTGEEPLSLAMLLDHHQLLDQVDIVASDISQRVLGKPLKGVYGKRSVRTEPPQHLVEKYLTPTALGFEVQRALVEKIEWKQLNLLEDETYLNCGTFDVILCRNVLIYFSDSTVRKVLDYFSKVINNNGFLFVGVSESLLRYGNSFIGEERNGSFVYRKENRL